MSKLFAATVQVLLEAKDQAHACDQVSALLDRPHWVQDWQYLAPAFHPPVEITEADAKQYFQQYGELTAPYEEEDGEEAPPRDPDFLYLERNGRASLYPMTAEAREKVVELTDEHGWVTELTPIETPGSLTGPLVGEGACLQDIGDIDFLYAEDAKRGGHFYPLSDRLKKQIGPGRYSSPGWHGPVWPLQVEEGQIHAWVHQDGMTYHQVEMPK